MASMMAIHDDETAFAALRAFVKERSGLMFDEKKRYFVDDRLRPILKTLGMNGLNELMNVVRRSPHGKVAVEVLEALTINETSFYRDNRPFEALRKFVLPELIEKRQEYKRLNIWCAAASTGQEPYAVAMMLRESFPELRSWKLCFTASDIDTQVLEKAKRGVYGQIEVNRGLPATLLVKYMQRQGVEWQVRADVREMVQFQRTNLIGNWPSMPEMDLIMMRNVLIYFDAATKEKVMSKVRRLLRPDGYLMLGATEVSLGSHPDFERVQFERSGFYRCRR